MLLGQSRRTSGVLSIFGKSIDSNLREIRQRTGIVPQADNLDPDFTVFENLRIYGLHFRIRSSLLEHRIPKLLKLVELDHRAKDRISTLSGGMQRRLILTRALINDPDLLVFNEPTTGLDPQARHMIWSLIHRLKRNGKTILLTTHYDDIVIGELLWCASKSLVSGSAILAVAAVLGAVADWRAVLALPATFSDRILLCSTCTHYDRTGERI